MVLWWTECITYSGVHGYEKAPMYLMIYSGVDGFVVG